MKVMQHITLLAGLTLLLTTCAQRSTLDREFVDPKTKVTPSGLTYSANPANYVQGAAIAANTPTLATGAATSYSVSPALPAGLSLSTTTGIITGTATATQAATNHTITAMNEAGQTNAVISITVIASPQLGTNLTQLNYSYVSTNTTKDLVLVVQNNASAGAASLDWQVTENLSYLSASPSSGTLAPQATVNVTVTLNTNGLTAGTKSDLGATPDTFQVTSATGGVTGSPRTINVGYEITNTLFVAGGVAGSNSEVRTSFDGITWSANTITGTSTVNGVSYFNGNFYLQRSTLVLQGDNQGANWSAGVNPGATTALNQLCYGSSHYVLVGANSGTARIWRTQTPATNGSYTQVHGTGVTLFACAYGNGTFVAVGGTGNIVYSTDDGAIWNTATISTANCSSPNLYTVAFGNGSFLAGGYRCFMYSANGQTWTDVSQTGAEYRGIVYGNGTWIAVGITSPGGGDDVVRYFTNVAGPYNSANVAETIPLYGVSYGNGRFIVVGHDSHTYYSTATNPPVWTRTCPTTCDTNGIDFYRIAAGP